MVRALCVVLYAGYVCVLRLVVVVVCVVYCACSVWLSVTLVCVR